MADTKSVPARVTKESNTATDAASGTLSSLSFPGTKIALEVSESTLSGGSDFGRPGAIGNYTEGSFVFSCPGELDYIILSDSRSVTSPGSLGGHIATRDVEIFPQSLTQLENGDYEFRFVFGVFKAGVSPDNGFVNFPITVFAKGSDNPVAEADVSVRILDDAPVAQDVWYESPDLSTLEQGIFAGLVGVEGTLELIYGADGKEGDGTIWGMPGETDWGSPFKIHFGPYGEPENPFLDKNNVNADGYIEVPGEFGTLYINPESGDYFYHVHSFVHPNEEFRWEETFTYILTDDDGSTSKGKIVFVHGGDGIVDPGVIIDPPVQPDPVESNIVVAESDLSWGSDAEHAEDNAGRPDNDESLAEGSFSLAYMGSIEAIYVNDVAIGTGSEQSQIAGLYGELTILDIVPADDGTYTLRYSYQLLENVPHDQATSLPLDGEEKFHFTFLSTDPNGNTMSQDAVINVDILDDTPLASTSVIANPVQGVENADDWGLGSYGNWIEESGLYGADGPASEGAFQIGLIREGEDTEFQTHDPFQEIMIEGDYGNLLIQGDGNYSYIITPNKAHDFINSTYTEVFEYKLTDADGSETTGKLNLEFGGDNIDHDAIPTLFGDSTNDTLSIDWDMLVIGGSGDELILSGNSGYSVIYGGEGLDRFGWDAENFTEGRDFIQDLSVYSGEKVVFSNLLSEGQSLDGFFADNISNATADYDGVYFTLSHNGMERDITLHFNEQQNRDYTDWIDLYVSQAGEWEHEVITHFLKGICE